MFWTKMLLLAIALWLCFVVAYLVMEKNRKGSLPALITLYLGFILELFIGLWFLIEFVLEAFVSSL